MQTASDGLTPTLPETLPRQLHMTKRELERFLGETRVAVLCWTTAKGEIGASPIWFRYQDGVSLLHTGHPSPKTRATLT